MAPLFNATFYATGATVIPILFLALAVQGRGFGDLLRAATMGREEAAANKSAIPFSCSPPRVLLAAAFVIMIAGFVGEGVATYDLYSGSASSGLMASRCWRQRWSCADLQNPQQCNFPCGDCNTLCRACCGYGAECVNGTVQCTTPRLVFLRLHLQRRPHVLLSARSTVLLGRGKPPPF